MRVGRLGFGVIAVAAFTVTACGSNSSAPATVTVTASSTQASAPSSTQANAPKPTQLSGMQEYQSVQALADDLTRFGHPCTVAPFNNDFAVQAGQCTTDVGELVLSLYLSQEKLDNQLDFVRSLARSSGSDYGWLVGEGWAIECGTRAACEALQSGIGGDVAAPIR